MSMRCFPTTVLVLVAVLASTCTAQPVTIKRDAVQLIDPERYAVTMKIEPVNTVVVVAPANGYVETIGFHTGDQVNAQAEVARMENTEAKFEYDRAQALLRVAKLERDMIDTDDTKQVELADARIAAAEAEAGLAKLRYERTTLESPFEGVVLKVHAVRSQYLKAGDPIMTIGDTTKVVAEFPMSRADAEVGKETEIKIDDANVKAKIARVQPLSARFDKLRDLLPAIVSAVVELDNAKGEYKVGQTVFSPLIPRAPVLEAPNSAIGNLPLNAGRKVQVIRDGFVRDIAVELMAGVGSDRSFISGQLRATDEIITKTSIPLADGTLVKIQTVPAATTPNNRRRNDDDD